ncbi:MAG: hypothetical protein AUG80_08475 [Candidatus Rokubacteria bacterium 13_1_20CM_4_68_9]|nr:MAG: hypothetical protein AUG80_08475 [Candidatus Rokubacteria bacterium 13_1_20CM_4_68_9]
MVGGNLAARLGGEGLDLLDTDAEALGRDERRDPAVAEPAGPAHGRLAVAADPQRERLLHGPGQHADALELPELAGERHRLFGPAAAHDGDRLVGATAALLEGHAGRAELALLLDPDADGGQHAPAREVVDHRHLAGEEHRRAERRDDDARTELEAARARGHRGHRRQRLEHVQRRRQAIGEPQRIDARRLAQIDETPELIDAAGTGGPRPGHGADAILESHGRDRTTSI